MKISNEYPVYNIVSLVECVSVIVVVQTVEA